MKITKNHVLPTKTAEKIAVFVNKQKKNTIYVTEPLPCVHEDSENGK
jgi:hypothetical protein